MFKSRNRSYVSEVDRFLKEFDKQHTELTALQKEEIAKHERIDEKRDHSKKALDKDKIWSDF